MFWAFSATTVLPAGVGLLLFITLPLHSKWLRKPSQAFVQKLLDIHFFDLKVLGEPVTVFHAILGIYGLLFLTLLKPWSEKELEGEDMMRRMKRWHDERNMYISAFIFVTYLMIFQYYNLRAKYDKVKAELKKIKEPAAAVSKKAD
jgi:hypothetical protein